MAEAQQSHQREAPVVVILAGGANSRFAPLQEKSLQTFCGQSLLRRQLQMLAGCGLNEVVIVTNPHNHELIAAETLSPTSTIKLACQQEPRGMGDALLAAREQAPTGRALYITQTHDIVDVELHQQILATWRQLDCDIVLAGKEVASYFPGGYLQLAEESAAGGEVRVTGISEKPGAGREPSNLVTIVAHLHADPTALWAALLAEYEQPPTRDDHYERALSALLSRQRGNAIVYRGRWTPIKYPWHMLDAMDTFLSEITEQRIAPTAQIDPQARVTGPVVIEEGVKIFAGAQISGPVYLGRATIVGNNALVRHSMIEANCVVGFATEIARSYVGAGCWFHSNYIGDSVLDRDVSFGSGGVTANLRLDEKPIRCAVKGERVDTGRNKLGLIVGSGTRFGVNVSTMPGVRVGAGSFIGAGVILQEDLEANMRVAVKQALHVAPNHIHLDASSRASFKGKL